MTIRSLFITCAFVCFGLNQLAVGQTHGGVPGGIPAPPIVSPDGQGWARFSPEGGGFSVLVPGTPTGGERTLHPQEGVEVKAPLYILRAGSDEFIIGYTPMAAQVHSEAFSKGIFDRARDSAVARLNATVVEDTALKVGEWPARRTKLVAKNTFVELLAVLAEYKMINLIVETPGTKETPEFARTASTFFDSLILSKSKDAAVRPHDAHPN